VITDLFPDPWIPVNSRLTGIGRRLTYGETMNSAGSSSNQPAVNTPDIDDHHLDDPKGILILTIISTKIKIESYNRFQPSDSETARGPISAIP
jgi:hypothetical protein